MDEWSIPLCQQAFVGVCLPSLSNLYVPGTMIPVFYPKANISYLHIWWNTNSPTDRETIFTLLAAQKDPIISLYLNHYIRWEPQLVAAAAKHLPDLQELELDVSDVLEVPDTFEFVVWV
jgi:hypothetical protein